MRILLLVLGLVLSQLMSFSQTREILFIGNSYVYSNDLPTMLTNLALSGGDSIITAQVTPGGYTLQGHSTNATTLAKIGQGTWDYVILQEQSQLPSFPDAQVESDVYPYARKLDSLIAVANPCTETIFFMTWGRKYGDQQNCQFFAPLCTFNGMQDRLRNAYLQMGVDNHATVAPVGVAWRDSWFADSTINLWSGDNSHPSVAGTYLSACVFYATIYQRSPVGLSFTSSLNSATAAYLQQVAEDVVLPADSLELFQVGIDHPFASFNYTNAGNSFSFNNTSLNYSSSQWFIDGVLSDTTQNFSHTFSSSGTYQLQLVASNSCFSDTITQTIMVTPLGLGDIDHSLEIVIYPNPVRDFLKVDGEPFESYEVIDPIGRRIQNGDFVQTIPVNGWNKGVYFIRFFKQDTSKVIRIIKD